MELFVKKTLFFLLLFSQVSLQVLGSVSAPGTVMEVFGRVLHSNPRFGEHIGLYQEKFLRGDKSSKSIVTIFLIGPGKRLREYYYGKMGQVVLFENEWVRHLENWTRFANELLEVAAKKEKLRKKFDAVRVVYLGLESKKKGAVGFISQVLGDLRASRGAYSKDDFYMFFSQGMYSKVANQVARACPLNEPIDLIINIAPEKKWSYRNVRFWKKKQKGSYRYKFNIHTSKNQMPKDCTGEEPRAEVVIEPVANEEPKKFGTDRRGLGRKVSGRICRPTERLVRKYLLRHNRFFRVRLGSN